MPLKRSFSPKPNRFIPQTNTGYEPDREGGDAMNASCQSIKDEVENQHGGQ